MTAPGAAARASALLASLHMLCFACATKRASEPPELPRPGCIPHLYSEQQAMQAAALFTELTNDTKSCSERAAAADRFGEVRVLRPAQPTAETNLEIERTGDLTAEDAECVREVARRVFAGGAPAGEYPWTVVLGRAPTAPAPPGSPPATAR